MPHEATDRKQAGCRACARHGDAVRRWVHDPGAGNGVARCRQDEALRAKGFISCGEGGGGGECVGAEPFRRQPHAGVAGRGPEVPEARPESGRGREALFVRLCGERKRSFEIIESELPREIDAEIKPIVKRVIHTTADFDYVENLCFSDGVVQILKDAIKNGADIVTDTQMAKSGINKKRLASFGGEVHCFISDEDVAAAAKENGTTRAAASMEKAARLGKDVIFAIGNAPTALVKLYELIKDKKINPIAIIGVPVGFVKVAVAKELIMTAGVPYIVARGRKGGSGVAAAICNAVIYEIKN